jgi:tetratricopeptide (TPR) repeat protein
MAGLAAAAIAIGSAAAVLGARERTHPLPVSTDRLMYLRSGKTASRLFLSFKALAADVYWMRAIQHYGRDRKSSRTTGRFEFLQPLIDLTTTLDPHFNLAYRFGAIFLAMDPPDGPGRSDQAIALLEKGLASNPTRWQYAHDIGFIHYWHTGDYKAAAAWFDRAAAMPGAPPWIRPLAGVTLAQGGDRTGARQLLEELMNSNEEWIRRSAQRSLAQLAALDEIDDVQAVVERYHASASRYPSGWADLVAAHLLPGVPLDPTREPLTYDADAHVVALSKASSLAPLPQALGRR